MRGDKVSVSTTDSLLAEERIAGKPNFKPEYDPVILALPWPGDASRRTGGRPR